jgi:hypothetical protein
MNKNQAQELFAQLDKLQTEVERARDTFDQEPDRRRDAGADEIAEHLTAAMESIGEAMAKIRATYELPDLVGPPAASAMWKRGDSLYYDNPNGVTIMAVVQTIHRDGTVTVQANYAVNKQPGGVTTPLHFRKRIKQTDLRTEP